MSSLRVFLVFALAGCTLSAEGKTACERTADCVGGYTCVDRVCVAGAASGERGGAGRTPSLRDGSAPGSTDSATDAGHGDAGASGGGGAGGASGSGRSDAGSSAIASDGGGSDADVDGNDAASTPSAGGAVVELAAGAGHTCARFEGGAVKCWGSNDRGQLGVGDRRDRGAHPDDMGDALPAVDLGPGRSARAIAAGGKHSCALLDDGGVKCWGNNDYGQLGQGSACLQRCGQSGELLDHRGDAQGELGESLPPIALGAGLEAQAVTAGDDFSCALLADGRVKCWGANRWGQLGIGTSCKAECSSAYRLYDHRGDEQGEMGDRLPAVELGAGRRAVALRAGGHHACVVLDDGRVKCWGRNSSAQLGSGDLRGRGDDPDEMGEALLPVALGAGRNSLVLAPASAHSCALRDDETLKCWGRGLNGRLGLGDAVTRGASAADLGFALPAVQLSRSSTARAVACGAEHCCATLHSGELKCWGANDSGQLGLGDREDRGDVAEEMGENLPAVPLLQGTIVTSAAAGEAHTCALLADGSVRCFGTNANGQLGSGGPEPLGDQADEVRVPAPAVDLGR